MPRTDNNQNPSFGRLQLDPTSGVQREFTDLSRAPKRAPGLQVAEQKQFRGQDSDKAWMRQETGADQFMKFLKAGVDLYKSGADSAQAYLKLLFVEDEAKELNARQESLDVMSDISLNDLQKQQKIRNIYSNVQKKAVTTRYQQRFQGAEVSAINSITPQTDEEQWFNTMNGLKSKLAGLDSTGAADLLEGTLDRLSPNNKVKMKQYIATLQEDLATKHNQTQVDVVKQVTESILQMTPQKEFRETGAQETILGTILTRLDEAGIDPSILDPEQNGAGAAIANSMVGNAVTQAKALGEEFDEMQQTNLTAANYVTKPDPSIIADYLSNPTRDFQSSLTQILQRVQLQGGSGSKLLTDLASYITDPTTSKFHHVPLLLGIIEDMDTVFYNNIPDKLKQGMKNWAEEIRSGNPKRMVNAMDPENGYYEAALEGVRTATNYLGLSFLGTLKNDQQRSIYQNSTQNPFDVEPNPTVSIARGARENGVISALINPKNLYHESLVSSYNTEIEAADIDEDSKNYLKKRMQVLRESPSFEEKEKASKDILSVFKSKNMVMPTVVDIDEQQQNIIRTLKDFSAGVDLSTNPVQTSVHILAPTSVAATRFQDENGSVDGFYQGPAERLSQTIFQMYEYDGAMLKNMRVFPQMDDELDNSEDYFLNTMFALHGYFAQESTDNQAQARGFSHEARDKIHTLYKTWLKEHANQVAEQSQGVFAYNSDNTISLHPTNPRGMSYFLNGMGEVSRAGNDPFNYEEYRTYFDGYIGNISRVLEAERVTQQSSQSQEDPQPFQLSAEKARELRLTSDDDTGFVDPLFKLMKTLDPSGLPPEDQRTVSNWNELSENIREHPEFVKELASLGTFFLSPRNREKYTRLTNTNPLFATMAAFHAVEVLNTSDVSITTSFDKAITEFFNPAGLYADGRTQSSRDANASFGQMFNLNGQIESLSIETGWWDETQNLGQWMLGFLPDSMAPNPNEALYNTPIITDDATGSLEASEALLGMKIPVTIETEERYRNLSDNAVMLAQQALFDAFSANPVVRDALQNNAYSRFNNRMSVAQADNKGTNVNLAASYLRQAQQGLPSGTEIVGYIDYSGIPIEDLTNPEKVLEAIVNGNASFKYDIRTGLSTTHDKVRKSYVPKTPLVAERRSSVFKKVESDYTMAGFDTEDFDSLARREQEIYSPTHLEFVSRTVQNAVNGASLAEENLTYRPSDGLPTLETLIEETIQTASATTLDRNNDPMVDYAPTARAAFITLGINGLTADSGTALGALIEGFVTQSDVPPTAEEIYSFVSDIKKMAEGRGINDEQFVSPLAVLRYDSNGRPVVHLNDTLRNRAGGTGIVDYPDLILKYQSTLLERGTRTIDTKEIEELKYGDWRRWGLTPHGFPKTTEQEYVLQFENKMIDETLRQKRKAFENEIKGRRLSDEDLLQLNDSTTPI